MLQLHLATFLLLAAVPTNSGVEGSGASGAARFVREVEGVSEYELACGVRLLVVPDLSSSTFSLVTTVLSGAADDPADARGVGHLIEHVLASQTLNHPHLKDEIASRGDDYGAAIGFEWTRYTVHLPYKADNLSWALDVAADRIENPLYTTESVQHQVPVIRQEEDLHRNDPRESLLRMAWQITNLSHPYHQAGTDPDLGRLTPEVMLAYHRLHYRPDNVIIVAIGPFSPLEAASAATRSFSKVRRPESSAYVRSTTPEPLQEGLRKFDLERAGRSNAAMLVWRTPPASDPDYAPLLVLQQLLDGASGHSLAANHALSKYEARVVSDLEVEGQSGFLSVYAEAARSVPATTIELAIKDGIASLLAGLSEDNVDAAKRTRAQAWRRKSFDSMEFAETLGTSASAGDWRLAFLVRDRVNAVLRQDVLRVARTYLKPANCTAGLLRAVDQPDLVRLGHGDAAALRDYGTQGPVDEGEAFDWSPPRLEERVLRGVLKGGLKFAILPVRMRGQHAVVSVTMHADVAMTASEVALAAKMLLRGTRRLTRSAFESRLQDLTTTVTVQPITGGFILKADIFGDHVNEVLELLQEAIRTPRFDSAEFAALKAAELSALSTTGVDAEESARIEALSHLYPAGVNRGAYVSSLAASMAVTRQATRDQTLAAYRGFVLHAAGEWVVVGAQQAPQVERQLHALLDSWVVTAAAPAGRLAPTPASVRVAMPGASVAALCAATRLSPFIGDDQYPAVQVGTILMATGSLFSLIPRRLRTKDGLSYSAWGRLEDIPYEPEPTLEVMVTYKPRDEAKVIGALKDELDAAGRLAFSGEDLERSKQLWLGRRRARLSDPASLALMIANQLTHGQTFADEEALASRVKELKGDAVVAAIRSFLAFEKMQLVFVSPRTDKEIDK